MIRFIKFTAILFVFSQLAWQALESSETALDPGSFVVGIAVAGLTGWAYFLISDWWSSVTRPYHPQTVKHETKETPAQITFAALWALVKGIIFVGILAGIIALIIRGQ